MKINTILIILLLFLPQTITQIAFAAQRIDIHNSRNKISLSIGSTSHHFSHNEQGWFLSHITVNKEKVVIPINNDESFFVNSGYAPRYNIIENSKERIELCFEGIGKDRDTKIIYRVDSRDILPKMQIEIITKNDVICTYRSYAKDKVAHGSWITRGAFFSDAQHKEVHIDGSGPFVFGHSLIGKHDIAYVWQYYVNPNIPRGRSEQKSDSYFKSAIHQDDDGSKYCYWQLRIGKNEPKIYATIWDKDLGGRVHDVCEKYYSDVVDSQVDINKFDRTYDAYNAIEKMPVRLSAPESFIPNYGWEMHEYYPYGKQSSYPYAHDSGIQTAALLSYEGMVTQREWEKNFGLYVVNKLPLWSDTNCGYFVKRNGLYTRWGYYTDYKYPFPLFEGGNWGASEQIYLMAKIANDDELKQKAIMLMKHDVDVKLNLDSFYFPPCWDPDKEMLTDHRDDWFTTVGLGYCAVLCGEILYPETGDKRYIEVADRLTDWLASYWGDEKRMNFLHDNVNTIHCFSGWLQKAMVQRYERSGNQLFLDIACDITWSIAMTLCITDHVYDDGKTPLFGITCVGARGCVDYDCTPHLCHEKDQPFIEAMGSILQYASGPAYAKYLSMQALMLPKDSWSQAWNQDQRELNLRTNYDNWARGMTNLAFGLNRSTNPLIQLFDNGVSKKSLNIANQRDIIVVNATGNEHKSIISVPYLSDGLYQVTLNGKLIKCLTNEELFKGVELTFKANNTFRFKVEQLKSTNQSPVINKSDKSVLLSDLMPFEAQRGTGNPYPVFRKGYTFVGEPLIVEGRNYENGLGLTANTVLFYRIDKGFSLFKAILAMDDKTKEYRNPSPSVNVSIFVDGRLCYESGRFNIQSSEIPITIPVEGGDVLAIRVSGNFDDNGDIKHDMVNLIEPWLIP